MFSTRRMAGVSEYRRLPESTICVATAKPNTRARSNAPAITGNEGASNASAAISTADEGSPSSASASRTWRWTPSKLARAPTSEYGALARLAKSPRDAGGGSASSGRETSNVASSSSVSRRRESASPVTTPEARRLSPKLRAHCGRRRAPC